MNSLDYFTNMAPLDPFRSFKSRIGIVMVLIMDELGITPILAIDGGGTRCRVAYSDGNDVVVEETGPANVSTDFDGSVREILEGVQRLSVQLGRDRSVLYDRPTFIGLAGMTGPALSNKLRDALPFASVRIEDDRPAALRGALGDKDGLLAHCGTGSFFGAQLGGAQRFVGGWGRILGDEASAFWIGRAALQRTLTGVDGLHEPSALTRRLLEDLGGAPGIVQFAATAEPADVAAIAQQVTAAADEDDQVATSIMRAGADEIAGTLKILGWQAGVPICLTGGVGPHFARHVPEDMRTSITEPDGSPLDGALSLARDLANEVAP